MLKEDKGVEDIDPVERAYIPFIKLKYDGIECNILFASLPYEVIDESLDILDSNNLNSANECTARSLNGSITTDMILKLLKNPEQFTVALKLIKEWAKRRGIYCNKMGYFGGGSLTILMCHISQLYPNASSLYNCLYKIIAY